RRYSLPARLSYATLTGMFGALLPPRRICVGSAFGLLSSGLASVAPSSKSLADSAKLPPEASARRAACRGAGWNWGRSANERIVKRIDMVTTITTRRRRIETIASTSVNPRRRGRPLRLLDAEDILNLLVLQVRGRSVEVRAGVRGLVGVLNRDRIDGDD